MRTRGFANLGLIETMGTKTRIQRSFKLVIAYSKFISKSCVTCVYKKDFVSIHSADNTPATVRYHWTLFYQFVCHCLFFCSPLFTHRCLSCFNFVIESYIVKQLTRVKYQLCYATYVSISLSRVLSLIGTTTGMRGGAFLLFQSRYRESYH